MSSNSSEAETLSALANLETVRRARLALDLRDSLIFAT